VVGEDAFREADRCYENACDADEGVLDPGSTKSNYRKNPVAVF
jgi:hypothetical protein